MRILAATVMTWLCLAGTSRAEDSVEELWTAHCKSCHGPDGKAKTRVGANSKIADMTSAKWQRAFSNEAIIKIVTDGSDKKDSKMKPFKEKLSAAEIKSLVPYIRAMKGK